MQASPRGREIEYVDGSPDGIVSRGEEITALGQQMRNSAEVLDGIKNNSLEHGGQRGKAVDKLKDSIGDSYETLYQAADLYEPVGPVITQYGNDLQHLQPLIKSAVGDSQDLWDKYEGLPGDVEPRGTGGLFEPDKGSPEAAAQADEDEAKKAAYEAWESRAEDFDAHYDDWEEAFDAAVNGITDGTSDSIKDGFWEALGDFADVLNWVALAVGILAIVIGGPFVAIAFALAAVFLIVTTIQWAHGDKTFTDVLLAAVSVIPLTKAGTLTKFMHAPVKAMKGATVGTLKNLKYGLTRKPTLFYKDGALGLMKNKGAGPAISKLLTGTEGRKAVYRSHKALHEGKGFFTGLMRNSGYVRKLSRVDHALSSFGHVSGYVDKATNNYNPDKKFGFVI